MALFIKYAFATIKCFTNTRFKFLRRKKKNKINICGNKKKLIKKLLQSREQISGHITVCTVEMNCILDRDTTKYTIYNHYLYLVYLTNKSDLTEEKSDV